MSSDTPSPETAEEIQVRLKPILGLQPKYYLAVIYVLVLLGVLFSLIVLPGLTNPGTRVTFTSSPSGASVTWGQKTWGTTPVTVFLPSGSAALTVAKPGLSAKTTEYSSGKRLLFSLFVPRTDKVDVKLDPISADSVTTRYRGEIGRWALAVPFNSDYRFPPLYTRFAEDARASGLTEEQIKAFLLGLRSSVTDPQMYQDYGQALGLWTTSVPEGLETQFKLWQGLVPGDPGRLALWLLANQIKPVRDRETAEPSDWFQARLNEFKSSLVPPSPLPSVAAPAAVRTSLGVFRGVASTWFLWGSLGDSFPMPTEPPFQLPVPAAPAPFWIADAEVTQGQFAAFVAAKPEWAPSGRDKLVSQGLADADYLADWKDGRPSAPLAPVVSVSWYAAQAYADWVNANAPAPGRRVVLPDDFQWEAAARAPGGSALLNQGVWEWTASPWYPGQSLVWGAQPSEDRTPAYAHSLKGGTQNPKGSIKAGDRAGWPSSGTTTGLGFRLALVKSP